MLRRCLSLAAAVLAPLAAAQPATTGLPVPGAAVDGATLVRWTTREGLPTNTLAGVGHDADGYLWITTNDGLVRFDGHRMTVYDRATTPALPSARFNQVVPGPDGDVWFASEGRYFVRHRAGRFAALPAVSGSVRMTELLGAGGALWLAAADGLHAVRGAETAPVAPAAVRSPVTAVAGDAAATLWVATEGQGVVALPADGPPRALGRSDGLPSDTATALHLAPDGALWVATPRGLAVVRDGRVERAPEPVGSAHIRTVVGDAAGGVWAVDAASDVWRVDGGTATQPLGSVVPGDVVVLDGAAGGPWAVVRATRARRSAVWRLGGAAPQRVAELDGIVQDVAAGPGGFVWLASSTGLYALRPQAAGIAAVPGATGELYAAVERADGSVWTTLSGWAGTVRIDPDGTATRLPPPPGYATTLVETRDGTLWAGATLARWTGTDWAEVRAGPAAEPLERVHALFEDADGWLWVSTARRLWRGRADLDPAAWRAFPVLEARPHDRVQVFAQATDGALLLGTDGSGLLRVLPPVDGDALRFEALSEADGLASDQIRDVWEDAGGALWIATENRGLCRLDRGGRPSLRGGDLGCLDVRHGLHANSLHRLLPDGRGRLWVNSNQGLFWVSLGDLDAWARGAQAGVGSVAYSEVDGLPAREGNGGAQNAGTRARDGRLWVPTMGGLVVVDPAAVEAPRAPRALIEAVHRADGAAPSGRVAELRAGERDVAVSFTTPAFAHPEAVRFQYRLAGFADGWRDDDGARRAVYTNLPPGDYTFEVRAGLGQGWGPPAALRVVRRAFWWETGWARGAAALAVLGLAVAGYRRRMGQAEARQRELEAAVDAKTAALQDSNEQLAEQAEALRHAAELQTRFLAGVSHEFRTPLTLTFGPIDDLLAGRFADLAAARPHFERARRNGGRLLRLIDQLLDLVRLEGGALRHRPQPQPLDVGAHVRQLAAMFASHAERSGVALRVAVADGTWTRTFDADLVEKVVVNLISNALKFTPAGGAVAVTMRAEPPGTAMLQVDDSGIGIPAEHVGHVFERFYQVESGGTRRYEGSGVGLALVRELVELAGGAVGVESAPGEGTRFTVRLPGLAEAAVPAGPPVELAPPTPTAPASPPPDTDGLPDDGPVVLVVEDNADMRAYVRAQLADEAHIEEAADGDEGVARARALVPDLVVADVMMPGLDGFGLCAALKADLRTSHVPVLLLTAWADVDSRVRGYESGADAYLAKPFDGAELRARVAGLLRERERLHARYAVGPPPGGDGAALPDAPALPDAEAAFLARLDALAADALADPAFTTDRAAEALGLSRRQLHRKVAALTGEPPGDRLRRQRLERAAALLAAGESVKATAAAVGFRSGSAFGRAFRQRFGVAPSAYAPRREKERGRVP